MKKTVLHGGPGSTPPPLSRISFTLALFVVSFLCSAGEMQAVPDQTPSILRDRIDAAADMLKDQPTLHAFSKERRRETIQFVVGNLLFVLLHEMGHVQVTEMGLPVLGREEDAADSYAAVKMLALKDAFSDRVLTEAARGWFYSDRRDRMEGVPIAFYDSHGLSRQRAYQIVCYMVGSDPGKFADLAEEAGLPEDRRRTCRGDFNNADWSWTKLLQGHLRRTRPRTEIRVRYRETGGRFEVFARIVESVKLLEAVAQHASNKYAWRAPFTIEAKSCGNGGADWNLATRSLTLCYEMAEDFAALYSAYGTARPIGERQTQIEQGETTKQMCLPESFGH